jgi:hypothetical protein
MRAEPWVVVSSGHSRRRTPRSCGRKGERLPWRAMVVCVLPTGAPRQGPASASFRRTIVVQCQCAWRAVEGGGKMRLELQALRGPADPLQSVQAAGGEGRPRRLVEGFRGGRTVAYGGARAAGRSARGTETGGWAGETPGHFGGVRSHRRGEAGPLRRLRVFFVCYLTGHQVLFDALARLTDAILGVTWSRQLAGRAGSRCRFERAGEVVMVQQLMPSGRWELPLRRRALPSGSGRAGS